MATERTLETWQEQIDPDHSCLLMVDLQNDFVHRDGWVAQQRVSGFGGDTGLEGATERATALLAAARAAAIPRVFVRMVGDDRYLSGPLRALYARNHEHERPPCVQEGTWGADWVEGLGPHAADDDDLLIDKHRYSSFIGTRLDLLLRARGIRSVVVCGVATSGCVESTIRDAFMLDYYVVVAGDACADYEPERHRASLSKMQQSFGTVTSAAEIAGRWTVAV